MNVKRRYWPANDPADRLGVAAARALSVFSVMAGTLGGALTIVNLRYLPEEWFVVVLGGVTALACGLAPAAINTGRPGFAWRARVLGGAVVAALVLIALLNGKVPQVTNVLFVPIVMTFTLILGPRDGAAAALVAAATQSAVWMMYVSTGEAPHWTTQLAAGMIASSLFAWAGASVFRHEMAKAMCALSEEKRRAEAADRAKTAFLANMSHEIRTPLNGVLGMADVLSVSALDADQKRSVALIRASGGQLLTMLNDILDLSKIEAGHMDLEVEPFSLEDLLDHVAGLYEGQARAQGVELALTLDRALDLGADRLGDRLRLAQVLTNLVSNAVKFTREGRVEISAAPGEGPDEVVLAVADTGCGMTPDELARVFEPFAQADVSTTRRFGGTGLGLSIVTRIVDLMGGRLEADSTPGAGSRFTLRLSLPRAEPVQRPAADAGAVDLGGLRVLVVDDSETNRLVAAGMLRPLKASVRLACGGREALGCVAEEAFDLILMDIRMPEMDGVAALKALRATANGAGVPALAMTANVMAGQIDAYLAAGFDAVIAKPLRPDALLQTVAETRRRSRAA